MGNFGLEKNECYMFFYMCSLVLMLVVCSSVWLCIFEFNVMLWVLVISRVGGNFVSSVGDWLGCISGLFGLVLWKYGRLLMLR